MSISQPPGKNFANADQPVVPANKSMASSGMAVITNVTKIVNPSESESFLDPVSNLFTPSATPESEAWTHT